MIVLDNGKLRFMLDDHNGSIRGLRDVRTGIDYIAAGSGGDPFRLETDAGFSAEFEAFEWRMEGDNDLSLQWRTADGVIILGQIALAEGDDKAVFRCKAVNGSSAWLLGLEYPIVPGLHAITEEGRDDYVAHAFATGFKVRNPMLHFAEEGAGFRFMPYPESFSGASMQFFAYYGMNKGGLYFAAEDGEGNPKWLNFFKNGQGELEATFIHGCQDMAPGRGIDPGYSVQVALLEGCDWYEAADRYKDWAVRQRWCSRGFVSDRAKADGFTWLHEEMGVATFGINAGSDRTAWLEKYHEHLKTPMFHVLGPDWTNEPQTFGWGVPGGFDDWFPTRFNADNIATMKQFGDRYAPFEFDYLYNFGGADGELGRAAAQKFPDNKKSVDAYRFPFLCPAHPYTHDFHVRRDAELQRTVGVDAIYYDISANNIMKICMDDSHGHPVGSGRLIEEAYRRNYADTKAEMQGIAGKYVPMGTEMINETMLELIDYYQARAGGQPAAPLEGYPIRDFLKSGEAELIPMFAYVYHEYGALRMDGWGKLTEEIGQLYYFTAARTYLWGGLYELNYEYSPMEALDGRENSPEEHYYKFDPRGYAFSPERADYLGMYARLRVGAANRYWAYGRMLRPLPIECSRIRMDWFHYNHGKETPEYNDSGEVTVDAVVHSAWAYKDESMALFFANVSSEPQLVRAQLASDRIGEGEWKARLYTGSDAELPLQWTLTESGELELEQPPRTVAMLERR